MDIKMLLENLKTLPVSIYLIGGLALLLILTMIIYTCISIHQVGYSKREKKKQTKEEQKQEQRRRNLDKLLEPAVAWDMQRKAQYSPDNLQYYHPPEEQKNAAEETTPAPEQIHKEIEPDIGTQKENRTPEITKDSPDKAAFHQVDEKAPEGAGELSCNPTAELKISDPVPEDFDEQDISPVRSAGDDEDTEKVSKTVSQETSDEESGTSAEELSEETLQDISEQAPDKELIPDSEPTNGEPVAVPVEQTVESADASEPDGKNDTPTPIETQAATENPGTKKPAAQKPDWTTQVEQAMSELESAVFGHQPEKSESVEQTVTEDAPVMEEPVPEEEPKILDILQDNGPEFASAEEQHQQETVDDMAEAEPDETTGPELEKQTDDKLGAENQDTPANPNTQMTPVKQTAMETVEESVPAEIYRVPDLNRIAELYEMSTKKQRQKLLMAMEDILEAMHGE